jgi:hypothetical protein
MKTTFGCVGMEGSLPGGRARSLVWTVRPTISGFIACRRNPREKRLPTPETSLPDQGRGLRQYCHERG